MSYNPGAGGSGGVWSVLQTTIVSDDATVDFNLTGSYKTYAVHIDNLIPAVDETQLQMRLSTNGGSSFLSGASDYAWSVKSVAPTVVISVDGADTKINLTRDSAQFMGNASEESLNGFVYIHNPHQATNACCITANLAQLDSEGQLFTPQCRGGLISNIGAVDAIQFFSSDGNLTSGRISLYGIDDS
jgi:hypothetical protein